MTPSPRLVRHGGGEWAQGNAVLTEESRLEIARLQQEYPDPRSALLAALALAQKDHDGWLPERAFDEIAELMRLPPSLVASTASFYTMLHKKAVGRHVIQVCRSVSCFLLGSDELLEHITRRLGIGPGDTTPDGKFTLVEVECLGSCGSAPAMQVGDCLYESLTKDRFDEILARLATE